MSLLKDIAEYQTEARQVTSLTEGPLSNLVRESGEKWQALQDSCTLARQLNEQLAALFPGDQQVVRESIAGAVSAGMGRWKGFPALAASAVGMASYVKQLLETSFQEEGKDWAETVISTCRPKSATWYGVLLMRRCLP